MTSTTPPSDTPRDLGTHHQLGGGTALSVVTGWALAVCCGLHQRFANTTAAMSTASGQVEEYVDELNGLAAQVKRNLALVGTLDEVCGCQAGVSSARFETLLLSAPQGSHGKLEELKAAQAAYLTGLKERVKAEKGKAAAGAELQAATVDEAALARIQELVCAVQGLSPTLSATQPRLQTQAQEVLGKSEEKVQVSARMEEMVKDALVKLGASNPALPLPLPQPEPRPTPPQNHSWHNIRKSCAVQESGAREPSTMSWSWTRT